MQQQVVRTRPPEGQHIDFVLPNILLSGFLFIGIGLVATGYHIAGFALAGWAALSILFCTFRAWSFDRHVWLSGNPVIVETPEPEVITKTEYAETDGTIVGKKYAYSGIHLEYSEWVRLAQYIVKKGGVSRDGLIALKIISLGNLKATVGTGTKYQDILGRFNRVGWLDGEKITPEGLIHFSRFLPPSDHPPTPQNNPDDSRTHEDDDGRTTVEGGEQ